MAQQLTLSNYLIRVGTMCLVPALLFSVWVGVSDFRYLSSERDEDMRDLARAAAVEIEAEIDSRINRLRALQAVTGDAPNTLQALQSAKAVDAAFGSPLALFTTDRRIIMHSRIDAERLPMSFPTPRGGSIIDAAFSSNAPQVGDVTKSQTEGLPMLPVIVPFKARGESLAWATSIRISDLEEVLRGNDVPSGWGLALMDGLGNVVAQHGVGLASSGETAGPRSIQHPVGNIRLTMVLHVSPLVFHRAALQTPLMRGAALLLLMAGLLAYIRHQSLRLHKAMDQLANPGAAAPAAGAPDQLRIAEIDAATPKLQRLDGELQRAHAEQQAAKDRHIRELQATVDSLARSEARMQAIFEGASEAVAILSDDLRVIRCNPPFAALLRETMEGIRHAHLLDYSFPDHRAKHLEVFERLRKEAETTGYSKTQSTVRVALKDGSRLTSESYTACLHLDTDSVFLMMARDVTERVEQAKRLERGMLDLSASHAALQNANQIIYITERRERERVSRDLHDGLQQDLAALKMHLEVAIAHLHDNRLDAVQRGMEQAKDTASAIIVELHRIVNDLHPRVLEDLGLVAALNQLTQDFARSTRIDLELEVVGDTASCAGLTPSMASALFRVTQECLNNVRKHADASFVHCELNASDPEQLVLTVSDDGRGFDADPNLLQGSHGLPGMVQRMRMLGGSIEFGRSCLREMQGGATVVVRIPLRA